MDEQKPVGVMPFYAFFVGVAVVCVALWCSFTNQPASLWSALGHPLGFSEILAGLAVYTALFGTCAFYLWLHHRNDPQREVGPAQLAALLYAVSALILLGVFLV